MIILWTIYPRIEWSDEESCISSIYEAECCRYWFSRKKKKKSVYKLRHYIFVYAVPYIVACHDFISLTHI